MPITVDQLTFQGLSDQSLINYTIYRPISNSGNMGQPDKSKLKTTNPGLLTDMNALKSMFAS